MSIIQGSAHTSAGGTPANAIERSLRFNSADSAYLNRTVNAVATSNTLTTFSFWFKRAKLGTSQQLFASATSAPNVACYIELTTSDTLKIYLDMTAGGSDETTWTTSAVFRDVSAWYGATIKVDTSQASNANKVVLYINGVSQTLTASQTGTAVSTQRILENGISLTIGKYFNSSGYGDFYLAEFYAIDGQALTPSSFGETDASTGVWKPKKYDGTYGNNGFYLKFLPSYSGGSFSADYLVVAGGAGAGSPGVRTGGGGAGGYRELTSQTLSVGTAFTVTVGAGGAAGASGSDSVFSTTTSTGGGKGGTFNNVAGTSGGSGGGGGGGTTGAAGGAGNTPSTSPSQGNTGGTGSTSGNSGAGGGGGGAGAVGGNASGDTGGNGGAGTASSITGSSVTRAGGGGGGAVTTAGSGGSGGGGAGSTSGTATAGTANTGGGGGGTGTGTNAAGGSGIVIIKIPNTYSANFTSGVTFSMSTAVSGYKIYTVTATSTTSETVTFV